MAITKGCERRTFSGSERTGIFFGTAARRVKYRRKFLTAQIGLSPVCVGWKEMSRCSRTVNLGAFWRRVGSVCR